MIIFLATRPKCTKLDIAGCIFPTDQKATISKFTLRLAIVIHQLDDSHCTRLLIVNLLLASMSLVFVPHTVRKILSSNPYNFLLFLLQNHCKNLSLLE